MGGGGGGSAAPVYHKRGAELADFDTKTLLETRGLGNPYVNEELKRRGLNNDGTPIRPDWESQLDPNTGLLKSQYQTQYGPDITADMRGLEAFRNRALQTGPSAWAGLAKDQQGLEEASLRSRLGTQAGSAAAQARSSLASKQGLSKGASERLAGQSMRDQMMGMQGIAAEGARARGAIGLQDEQMRQQALGQLPGMEIAATQPQFSNRQMNLQNQQWNIQNALNEQTQKRANDANVYNQKMQTWAGQQQANAMRDSGGGGKK